MEVQLSIAGRAHEAGEGNICFDQVMKLLSEPITEFKNTAHDSIAPCPDVMQKKISSMENVNRDTAPLEFTMKYEARFFVLKIWICR